MKAIDITGQVFNRLTVLHRVERPDPRRWWLCRCECGNTVIAGTKYLTSGNTKSCGCLRADATQARRFKHGHSNGYRGRGCSPEYRTWQHMLYRCTNPNAKDYPYYGGRGVTVCERWRHDFTAFLTDMGRRPSVKHSIDRRDNNGHYEPANCYWATMKQQANNRRPARRSLP